VGDPAAKEQVPFAVADCGCAQGPTASPRPVRAVEERISSIMSAAENAILTLKNECKRQLVLLPVKVRLPAAGRRSAAGVQRSCDCCWAVCLAFGQSKAYIGMPCAPP
jgi:hypothetical protein